MYQECRHIMPSGAKCHSPAMRGTAYCYFHAPARRLMQGHSRVHKKPLTLPALTDRSAIQAAVHQVLDAISASTITDRSAGQFLFGLQIASDSLRRAGRPPKPNSQGPQTKVLINLLRYYRHCCCPSSNCSSHPASLWSPVISRALRVNVKYDQIHVRNTEIRFLNPIRKKICTVIQVSHAGSPLMCALNGHSTLATAAMRPIVAMSPLSK